MVTSPSAKIACVKLETLIEDKKLKKPLVDASTKKEIPLNNSVRITVEANNNYSYEIVGNKNCENMYTDITPPIATIDYESYTDRIKVEAVCSDIETGIKKYEFSKDGGKTWIDQGETNNYTFKNLTEFKMIFIYISLPALIGGLLIITSYLELIFSYTLLKNAVALAL